MSNTFDAVSQRYYRSIEQTRVHITLVLARLAYLIARSGLILVFNDAAHGKLLPHEPSIYFWYCTELLMCIKRTLSMPCN